MVAGIHYYCIPETESRHGRKGPVSAGVLDESAVDSLSLWASSVVHQLCRVRSKRLGCKDRLLCFFFQRLVGIELKEYSRSSLWFATQSKKVDKLAVRRRAASGVVRGPDMQLRRAERGEGYASQDAQRADGNVQLVDTGPPRNKANNKGVSLEERDRLFEAKGETL